MDNSKTLSHLSRIINSTVSLNAKTNYAYNQAYKRELQRLNASIELDKEPTQSPTHVQTNTTRKTENQAQTFETKRRSSEGRNVNPVNGASKKLNKTVQGHDVSLYGEPNLPQTLRYARKNNQKRLFSNFRQQLNAQLTDNLGRLSVKQSQELKFHQLRAQQIQQEMALDEHTSQELKIREREFLLKAYQDTKELGQINKHTENLRNEVFFRAKSVEPDGVSAQRLMQRRMNGAASLLSTLPPTRSSRTVRSVYASPALREDRTQRLHRKLANLEDKERIIQERKTKIREMLNSTTPAAMISNGEQTSARGIVPTDEQDAKISRKRHIPMAKKDIDSVSVLIRGVVETPFLGQRSKK